MGITSSADLKPENSDPKSQSNQVASASSDWRDQLQVFMEEGGCKDSYTAFRDCTEKAEKNNESIGKCWPMLDKCMEAHSDYYQPILAAEKDALQLVIKGLTVSPNGVSDQQKEEEDRLFTFLKGGACKESFMAWYDCTEEAEKNKQDFITKCAGVSATWGKCLDAHADYYRPFLDVAKNAEQQMEKELQDFFSRKG